MEDDGDLKSYVYESHANKSCKHDMADLLQDRLRALGQVRCDYSFARWSGGTIRPGDGLQMSRWEWWKMEVSRSKVAHRGTRSGGRGRKLRKSCQ